MPEEPWSPLETERPINRPIPRSILDTAALRWTPIEGIHSWSGIPVRETFWSEPERFNVPPRAQYTDKNYLEGIDWESHNDRDAVAREHPIEPDEYNVGQQFIDRIEPLFSKMRRRPLSESEYSVHLTSAPSTPYSGSGYQMVLAHHGVAVGRVSWEGGNGYVGGLYVDGGHRHMTTKLLQEAWDVSRKRGHYGPAASNELTNYSGKIVEKFNPEAEAYKESNYAGGDNEDEDARWERLSEEAWESHQERNGAPCETCGGAGESRLYPDTHGERDPEHGYLIHFTGPGRYREVGNQTLYGTDSEGNDHEFEYYHPANAWNRVRTMTHSPAKEGYSPDGRVTAIGPTGENIQRPIWVKPCPDCGHLNLPGFPDSEVNQ